MSFKENSSQQLSFTDSFFRLTAREQKALEKSWAKVFAEELFPAIDEKRFALLYSDKASRPNTPVNVIVGALIIKELFDYSDDEMVENLMLDLHLQYALHTTSYEEQPLSDKTLSRFRKRCYDYETLHNQDLYHDCVKDLSGVIAKIMGINGRVRRMDSMMIESNIRKLSRMELIYTCIAKLAARMEQTDHTLLPEDMKHYVDPNDFNKVIYHQRSSDTENRMQDLLTDADRLLSLCSPAYENITEYELFVRCLSEQTVLCDGERRLRTKGDATMNSTALQNPSDPEATFRSKAGKSHRGYVANLEESVGKEGSVITEYQYEQNIHSDSQFLKEHLEQMEKQGERVTIVTDGAYSGTENKAIADAKNVDLITTSLTGREAPDIIADFEFNEEGTKVLRCPAGHTPKSCSYRKSSSQCNVSFDRNLCVDCPYCKQCNPQIFKRIAKIITSRAAHERAKIQRSMQKEEFKNYARLRNGVETVPSNIRHNYHLEDLPRGKQRGKFSFGCKVAALNFRKLFNFRKGLGRYAPNPVIA
jgi:Transposase DDE domain/Transposase domain (DUF772)